MLLGAEPRSVLADQNEALRFSLAQSAGCSGFSFFCLIEFWSRSFGGLFVFMHTFFHA